MGMLKLSTASGGSITLDPTNTASNLTITVPAQTATLATLTTPSFASTIGVGGATAAASGAGITFPATQSASTDANTLDDYEEGTWTPNVGGNATYSVQAGTYVKIGKLVIAHFDIQINALGTGSATTLSGLPFTAAGANQGNPVSIGYWTGLGANAYSLMMRVDSGSASMVNQIQNTLSGTPTAGANIFANSTRITGAAIYQTS